MPSSVTHLMQARWLLLTMTISCFFVLSSQRINMSIAILNMVVWESNTTSNYCLKEEKEGDDEKYGEFNWSISDQAQIHASYFYGLVLMQIPAEILVETFSSPSIAVVGMTLSTASTLLVPVAANWHIDSVIYVQITKAMGHALLLPAFSVMMGMWIPTKRLVRFMAYGTSGIQIGAFITPLLGGILCNSPGFRWPYMFYFSGGIGVAWCLLWAYLCFDLTFMPTLTTGKKLSNRKYPQRTVPVPVRKILTSKPFWGYATAGIASYWMIAMNIFVMPTYFRSVFGVAIEWNGLLSAFPNVLQAFLYLFSFAILLKKSSAKTTRRRLTICMGMVIFATCVVLLTFVKCRKVLGVGLMMIGIGASGLSLAAIALIPLDMSPNFSGILSSIVNTIGAASGCGLPLMVGYLTGGKKNDFRDWEKVFYASAFVVFISMILFMAFSSFEIQPWNYPESDRPTIIELSLSIPDLGRKSSNVRRGSSHSNEEGIPSISK